MLGRCFVSELVGAQPVFSGGGLSELVTRCQSWAETHLVEEAVGGPQVPLFREPRRPQCREGGRQEGDCCF